MSMLCRSVALLAFLLCTSFPALSAEVQFGSLVLQWPDGFAPTSTKPPFQLTGPNGETVLVTTMRQRNEPPPPGDAAEQGKMAEVGEKFVSSQAEKVGTVVMPLERSKLPDGTLIYHIGSKTSSLFSTGFFVQYLLVSPVGRLAFITVEGKGDVATEHAKYLGPVGTARWLE